MYLLLLPASVVRLDLAVCMQNYRRRRLREFH